MQIDLDFKLQNRSQAAIKLLENLSEESFKEEDWIIFALDVNALALTNIIAKRFRLKYDILFNESIVAPNNQECKIAIVNENRDIVIQKELSDSFDISLDYIYGESDRKYEEEILKKIYDYRKGLRPISMQDKNILFIDDACEDGFRAMSGIKAAINNRAKKIAYMCAVIPKEIEMVFEKDIDRLYYLYSAYNYIDNQHYYIEKLEDLQKDDILAILENSENFVANLEDVAINEEGEKI
ncbi:MAG: ABC transporter [Epsilonproteobacteria bacterium]|nr:ABC transporter [Campylobacterota bacterium]